MKEFGKCRELKVVFILGRYWYRNLFLIVDFEKMNL